MNFKIIASLLCATLLFAAHPSHADILSLYEFDVDGAVDINGNEISVTSDTHTPTTSLEYNTRSNVTGLVNQSGVAPSSHAYLHTTDTPETLDPSTSNFYHEFTTTVDSGNWSLDAVTFDYFVNAAPNNSTFGVHVYSDRTGFDSEDDRLGCFELTSPFGGNTGVHVVALNFDNPELQNLGAGDSTTFRFYFADDTDLNRVHRINDVELRGSVAAIPEPGIGLLAVGLTGFFGRRRRRRASVSTSNR